MITVKNAENALKTVYLGAVTELLNTQANPLLAKIEHTASDVWGKEIRKAAKIGINGGIGAGEEDGALPSAGSNKYLQFVSTLKNLYGQIEISDKAIRASADGKGAFTDLLNSELEGLLQASRFNLGRMLYGDGTGRLCSVTDATNRIVDSTRNIIEGICVDIYKGANLVSGGNRIVGINRQTRQITFENTVTLTNGDNIFVQGSKDKEITGLGAIFATSGTLYGLDRSANPILNAYSKNVGGAIDEIMIQEAIDNLEMDAGSKIDFISCSADVKYAYQEYMAQYKRNIDIMELNGGFKTLSYNGIPLVYDRFVENGTMYLLDTSILKMHQLCDWRYLETENGNILRQAQGKPTYTATLVKYCDLICDRPNGVGRLTGITRV